MTIYLRRQEKYFSAVKLSDIKYIEADSNYSVVVTVKKEFILSRTLLVIENAINVLDKEGMFIRVNRSALINKNYVDQIHGNSLYIGNKSFVVSKQNRKSIPKLFVML